MRIPTVVMLAVLVTGGCRGFLLGWDHSAWVEDCTPAEGQQCWAVDDRVASCTGEGNQTCLVVKVLPDGEWELHYDGIQGFEHQDGFVYTLKVRVETVENPPADGSSRRTILVEEVARRSTASPPG